MWVTACSDGSGPGIDVAPIAPLPGLIVSQPVGEAGAAAGSVPALGAGSRVGELVYVSLVPGSVPDGRQATIHNDATGQSVTAFVVNGGFDPVALTASVGDTLLLDISRTGSVASVKAMEVVRRRRPPVVVRTSPPVGARDVVLNSVMVIVFSTPIDSATADSGSVKLWRGTTPVAGSVRFGDATHLRLEFHPDSLLASATEYQLVVTTQMADLNGLPLEAPIVLPFTTGTTGPATGLVFASVTAGFAHTCGVTTSGKAYCWGENVLGQLGDGTSRDNSGTPVPVAGGLTFASVSAGYISNCGVATDGTAYCWGHGYGGGYGIFDSATVANGCSPDLRCPAPLAVASGHTFKMVSVRVAHVCGVTTDGAAYCWGSDASGQLGDGATTDQATPVPVAGGLTFATVSTGEHHSCGVTTDGAAYCWGDNSSGQLGNGTVSSSLTPVPVGGGLTFTGISAGYNYTCGMVQTGATYCWGTNGAGQLGSGSPTGPQVCVYDPYNSGPCSTSPVPVTGGLIFRAISAGWDVTCGVTTNGAGYCWGWRNPGSSAVPLPVSGGLAFASVSVVESHACGLTSGGVAYCWGGNGSGELGDGTLTDSWGVPVKVAGQP
jgi:alpha-tubulin suppressor-like RCC1 family protein